MVFLNYDNLVQLKRVPIHKPVFNKLLLQYKTKYTVPLNMDARDLSLEIYKTYDYEYSIYFLNKSNGYFNKGEVISIINPKYIKNFAYNYMLNFKEV